jgi:hypothetical protein
MIAKTYLSANDVTRDSFLLARRIFDSGFRPDALIALWRGGSPVGIAVQEFLRVKGVDCYHTVVKCTSYTGIGMAGTPAIENMDYVRAVLRPDSRVLVVDDIFDSGATARCIKAELNKTTPHVRFAMPYFKPSHNVTTFAPDYYVRETDHWLVFPHELMDLTPDEIRAKDPFLYDLLFK